MNFVRSFPPLAFVLVLLSIVAVSIAQESVAILLVGGTLAALSWYITEGPRGRTLPRWVSNVLMIALSLNAFVEVMKFPEPEKLIATMARFGVWLVLIKLYERKTSRDHAHLLMLSLLLMLTGSMQSTTLVYGMLLLVYVILGMYVLLLFQFYAHYERMRNDRAAAQPADATLVPSVKPIVGRHPGLHFRMLAVLIAVAGMGISMFVFTLYPRTIGQGMLREIDSKMLQRRSGYNDEIDLLNGQRITDSKELAMTVTIRDPSGRAVALDRPLYLRGAVLEVYRRGGSWRSWPRPSARIRLLDTGPKRLTMFNPDAPSPSDGLTMYFEYARPVSTIFSLYAPYAISTDVPMTISYVPDTLTAQREIGPQLERYTLVAFTNPEGQLLDTIMEGAIMRIPQVWKPGRAPARTAVYNDSRRVAELAQQLLVEAGIPVAMPSSLDARMRWNRDVARTYVEYLRSVDFRYTLDLSGTGMSPGQRVDPVEHFLFQTKRGHCEYFASALTALCHGVGAQARLVTGYVVVDYDSLAGRYNVMESNAHAWVEVRTSAWGWEQFDPTPPATLLQIHSADNGIADRLRWMYQQFEDDWNSNVVEFDRDAQVDLADSFDVEWSLRFERWMQDVRARMARINQAFALGPTGYIWMATIAFAAVLAFIVLVRVLKRVRTIRRGAHLEHLHGRQYRRMVRQVGFYIDMLNVLHRAKLTKPSWQPPQQFGETLASARPEAARLVDEITRAFYRVRYGGHVLQPSEVESVDNSVRALAQHLNAKR
jgi:transglutaminase-like putative cysteine protease